MIHRLQRNCRRRTWYLTGSDVPRIAMKTRRLPGQRETRLQNHRIRISSVTNFMPLERIRVFFCWEPFIYYKNASNYYWLSLHIQPIIYVLRKIFLNWTLYLNTSTTFIFSLLFIYLFLKTCLFQTPSLSHPQDFS